MINQEQTRTLATVVLQTGSLNFALLSLCRQRVKDAFLQLASGIDSLALYGSNIIFNMKIETLSDYKYRLCWSAEERNHDIR
jgi:hypothetical protein